MQALNFSFTSETSIFIRLESQFVWLSTATSARLCLHDKITASSWWLLESIEYSVIKIRKSSTTNTLKTSFNSFLSLVWYLTIQFEQRKIPRNGSSRVPAHSPWTWTFSVNEKRKQKFSHFSSCTIHDAMLLHRSIRIYVGEKQNRDENENIKFWLSSISFIFPSSVAHEQEAFSFTNSTRLKRL